MSNEIDFTTRTAFPLSKSLIKARVAISIKLPKNRMEAVALANESVKDPIIMQQLLTELLIKSEKL